MTGYLVRIDGYDPVAAAPVTLRAASHDDERICHLDDATWWPAIAELPKLPQDNFDGDFGGRIAAPASSLMLRTEPWPSLGRYALADARLRIWSGVAGTSWPGWTLRFDGRVRSQPRLSAGSARIEFAVDDRWLDAPLLATYAGTGGIEGPQSLKGLAKPLMLGRPRYASGQLIDPINIVLQLSAYGAIEGVEDALDGLARFGAPAEDFASYGALVAAALAPGQWATAKAAGMVRQAAPPFGQLSYMVRGDKAGPDGWARLPGEIIRRIALLANGAGRIDDASLDALDLARPWPLSLSVTEQTTARELIQRIAASVNATAGVSWLGKLYVVPVGIGASSVELRTDGSALPPVENVEQVEAGPPWWRLAIEAERTWTVHPPVAVQYTTPAEPGATVGAPPGTIVGDRDAQDVIDDLNFNADTMAEQILRGDGFETLLAARTLIDGVGVNTVLQTFRQEQTTTNTAVATTLDLMGAEVDGGSAFQLNAATVRVKDGESFAATLDTIEASLGDQNASIEQLNDILIDPSGATVRSVIKLNNDGHVTGTIATNDGTTGEFIIVADRFGVVDPNGGAPLFPLLYEDGLLKLKEVEVEKLSYGALVPLFGDDNNNLSATSGFQKLPGGMIMQWGKIRKQISDEQSEPIVFPTPFPEAVVSVTGIPFISTANNFRDLWLQLAGEPTLTGATFYTQSSTANSQSIQGFDWVAFGY